MRLLKPLSLQSKMVSLITLLVLFLIGIVGAFSGNMIAEILEDQIGKRALKVSQTVAHIPEIAELLSNKDPEQKIQILVDTIRIETGAQFIVVGDIEGRRYSHPVPERLGKLMVGGDNDAALLEGKSYVSKAIGTLGPSIRGKVPVHDKQGNIIGIVSVGYLEENIQQISGLYQSRIISLALFLLVFGVLVALWMARSFKQSIFGLEPAEIARLFQEKNAVLESIREGIIAINREGRITLVNQTAVDVIGLQPANELINQKITNVLPNTGMMDVLETGVSQLDTELQIGNSRLVVNRVPIIHEQQITGVVSSFRRKDEIDILAKQLSRVREYSDLLRIQTHEYSNKLYTISGLIQIEAYDKAIQLIISETTGYQDLIQFLVSAVPDSVVAGAILGKYNRARELKIDLIIDRESRFSDIPEHIDREKIVTILGNLLDNAFNAVNQKINEKRKVLLSLTDLGTDLIIEIEDAGHGIPTQIEKQIFDKDFSTSSQPGKGVGLYLVQQTLNELNGHLTLTSSSLGGALFSVYLPKHP